MLLFFSLKMEKYRRTVVSKSTDYFKLLIILSIVLRLLFFAYGIYQDSHFKVKYTDIDYHVFNDASKYIFMKNGSPFDRDTYRYTPLLAWIILLNHWFNWFHLAKILFIVFDIITGVILIKLLKSILSDSKTNQNFSINKIYFYVSSIWLMNPFVITISTRGNCETLLCFLIISTFYLMHKGHIMLSGILYGLSIHFKIYPIIYCGPISFYLLVSSSHNRSIETNKNNINININTKAILNFVNFSMISLFTLTLTTCGMYYLYGDSYLQEAWLYHIIRIDHRHNFSVWNVLLYYTSTMDSTKISLATFAFLPQFFITIIICGVWLPYHILYQKVEDRNKYKSNDVITKSDQFLNLLKILFIQTFSFVTFNKVCTSQYFIWYIIFLPFVIVDNKKMDWKWDGIPMIVLWVGTQAVWLQQGYNLEFLGLNVFYPNLLFASIGFFLTNVYIIGQFIQDLMV